MKLAVWSYTAAVGFASLAVAGVGRMVGKIYPDLFNGKPLPAITDFVVGFYGWACALLLLWLFAAAWLSRRGAATPERVLAFAGISTLAVTVLFGFTALALVLPFLSLVVSLR